MAETWTIQRLLSWMSADFAALGISSPRLDGELLLCRALGCDRVRLYMDITRPLEPRELDAVRALVKRRRAREPVAYILGEKEFYRRPFRVGSGVLVPRPETEVLVDRALEALPRGATRALDLCTGSGAIAITLAAERPQLQVTATDLSPEALAIARDNAQQLGVAERVELLEGDLYGALRDERPFDLIVSNPPYVAEGDWGSLAPEITQHEPRLALLAGGDGLDIIRRICDGAGARLAPAGVLLMEVGAGQARAVVALLQAAGLQDARTHDDLAGIARVVQARAPG